ncbi:hypothetical protein [Gallaecimonas xiamenensis]|uniref:hypothetical protein n=1 Tax=Gallaecimonas xiamenensis TaxID=1207039 RepID=UPI0004B422CD|nr:hypothetical protein [Gallaecimonas xiamenensis]
MAKIAFTHRAQDGLTHPGPGQAKKRQAPPSLWVTLLFGICLFTGFAAFLYFLTA